MRGNDYFGWKRNLTQESLHHKISDWGITQPENLWNQDVGPRAAWALVECRGKSIPPPPSWWDAGAKCAPPDQKRISPFSRYLLTFWEPLLAHPLKKVELGTGPKWTQVHFFFSVIILFPSENQLTFFRNEWTQGEFPQPEIFSFRHNILVRRLLHGFVCKHESCSLEARNLFIQESFIRLKLEKQPEKEGSAHLAWWQEIPRTRWAPDWQGAACCCLWNTRSKSNNNNNNNFHF